MRGAGPSFGITTAIKVKTFPAPSSVTVFQYVWNMNPTDAANAVSVFQHFTTSNIPSQFSGKFVIGRGHAPGKLSFNLTGAWYGPKPKFNSVVHPFLSRVGPPHSEHVATGSYIDSVTYFGGLGTLNTSAPDSRDTFYAKSLMTPAASPISNRALLAFMNYMTKEGFDTNLVSFAFHPCITLSHCSKRTGTSSWTCTEEGILLLMS